METREVFPNFGFLEGFTYKQVPVHRQRQKSELRLFARLVEFNSQVGRIRLFRGLTDVACYFARQ